MQCMSSRVETVCVPLGLTAHVVWRRWWEGSVCQELCRPADTAFTAPHSSFGTRQVSLNPPGLRIWFATGMEAVKPARASVM